MVISVLKVVIRSSSLLFSVVGIAANAPVAKVRPILRRGAAGDVRIGMTVEAVEAQFGPKVRSGADPGCAHIFLVSALLQSRPDISLAMKDGVVSTIRVYSRRFKTEAGIGAGDSLDALRQAYPIRWLDDDTAEAGELGMRFEVVNDRIASILIL